MHRVQPGREPGRDLVAAQLGRQLGHRHQATVGQVAAEDRRAIGQQLAAHPAPEAVAAEQRGGLVAAAVLGPQPDAGIILFESMQALAQPAIDLTAALQLAQQDLVQVGTVDGRVGLAVALLYRCAQGQAAELIARTGVAHAQALGEGRDPRATPATGPSRAARAPRWGRAGCRPRPRRRPRPARAASPAARHAAPPGPRSGPPCRHRSPTSHPWTYCAGSGPGSGPAGFSAGPGTRALHQVHGAHSPTPAPKRLARREATFSCWV